MSGAVPPEAWPPSMQHPIGSTRNGIAGRNMGLCCTFGLMAKLQSPSAAITRLSLVIAGAPMRTPPGESAEASPGTVLRFKEMDAASHNFSTLDPVSPCGR